MNFDHLCRSVIKNKSRLRDVIRTFRFLQYHLELLRTKKKKLKLGKVVFEIKQTLLYNTTIFIEFEMRHSALDTTDFDEKKVENIMKRQG